MMTDNFAGLSNGTRQELANRNDELKKWRDDELDLDTHMHRGLLVERTALALGLGKDADTAAVAYYESRPDAYKWVQNAPMHAPVPKAPVQKSLSQTSVKERVEKRWEQLARDRMRENPKLDYNAAYCAVLETKEGSELYKLYSDAFAESTLSEFKDSLTPQQAELSDIVKRNQGKI